MRVERLEMLRRSYRKTEQNYRQEIRRLAEIQELKRIKKQKLSDHTQAFRTLKKRLLLEGRRENDPRAVFQNVRQLDKQLSSQNQKVEDLRSILHGISGQHNTALKQLLTIKKKLERLGQLIQKGEADVKIKHEAAGAEAIGESRVAANLACSSADKLLGTGEKSAVDADSWGEIFQERSIATAECDVGEAGNPKVQPLEVELNGSAIQTNSGGASGERSPADASGKYDPSATADSKNGSTAENARKQTEMLKDFAAQITEVTGWKDERGAGVSLTYTTSQGRKLDLQIIGSQKESIKVEIAPENPKDRLSLWGEKHKIKTALEEAGLQIEQVLVTGGLSKKGVL